MFNLPAKHAENIASMINDINVARHMVESCTKNQDWDGVDTFHSMEILATIQLNEFYGIELPGYYKAKRAFNLHNETPGLTLGQALVKVTLEILREEKNGKSRDDMRAELEMADAEEESLKLKQAIDRKMGRCLFDWEYDMIDNYIDETGDTDVDSIIAECL